tara:strand:- start:55356 stop:56804 length:1449 start_codon:yes stop_codon:yes gene_type:complete
LNKKPDLWRSNEVAEILDVQSSFDWIATGVSIDSRTVCYGDLFIPLKGNNFDGHNFILDAFNKGAVAAVSENKANHLKGLPILVVNDAYEALNKLALEARKRCGAKIIAVTGSVGKTSIKDAIGKLLSAQGRTFFSPESYNNHIGVPLSLTRLPLKTEYAVLELGMNHAGEIKLLSEMVKPDIAIISNIEPVHIEFFSSLEEIAMAKAEIFEGLKLDGVAILNRDNKYFDLLSELAFKSGASKVVSFGLHEDAYFRLIEIKTSSSNSLIRASKNRKEFNYKVTISGEHWAFNSIVSLAAIYCAGANLELAAASFSDIKPLKGRGETHIFSSIKGKINLIDDSYNASPVSVSAAINLIKNAEVKENGRRILVLGDMMELGSKTKKYHLELAPKITEAKIDLVYVTGKNMEIMSETLPDTVSIFVAKTSQELIDPLLHTIKGNDLILIKGSAAMSMSKVVDAIRDRFDILDPEIKKSKERLDAL